VTALQKHPQKPCVSALEGDLQHGQIMLAELQDRTWRPGTQSIRTCHCTVMLRGNVL